MINNESFKELSFEVEKIKDDLFNSKKLAGFRMNNKGAFGGLIVAQAVHSATKTVETKFNLNSLHCYFVRTGDVNLKEGVNYEVDRLRDGKNYCTRSVKAIQDSKCIFMMMVSFHKTESNQLKFFKGLSNQNEQSSSSTTITTTTTSLRRGNTRTRSVKDEEVRSEDFREDGLENFRIEEDVWRRIPKPKDCMTRSEYLRKVSEISGQSDRVKNLIELQLLDDLESSVEFLHLGEDGEGRKNLPDQIKPNSRWFRFKTNEKYQQFYQKIILTYCSDFYFIGTVSQRLGLSLFDSESNFGMTLSLDHSMFFYDHEIDVSKWMLYQMEGECSRFGRGLVIGRIFDETGNLLAICTQEGVVRQKSNLKDQDENKDVDDTFNNNKPKL